MSSNLALSVHNLTKEYRIAHQNERPTTLGEALVKRIRNPLSSTTYETFRALDDVSFEVEKGEVLGVIGRNGAGKSTLLKILSRITEPTGGEVRLFGRIGSLLEVGTGFHPELSGRENIFLNGAILGMRHKEIARQFDAIVDFAEVERFLDTPVKRYSSGMYVRLAFAVAAHLNPEILVVDEVLAVGDAQFQKKCLGKMQEVSRQEGRTVLFVSHNMAAVGQLCSKALWLESGRAKDYGETGAVLAAYNNSKPSDGKISQRATVKDIEITAIQLLKPNRKPTYSPKMGDQVSLWIALHCRANVKGSLLAVVYDEAGKVVSSLNTKEEIGRELDFSVSLEVEFPIESIRLFPGTFTIKVIVGSDYERFLTADEALTFTVLPHPLPGVNQAYQPIHGIFRLGDGCDVRPCSPELLTENLKGV